MTSLVFGSLLFSGQFKILRFYSRFAKEMDPDQKDWLLSVISLQTSILSDVPTRPKDQRSALNVKKVWRKKKSRSKVQIIVPQQKKNLTNGDADSSSEISDCDSISTASECSLGLDEEDEQVLSHTTKDELREYLAVHAKARQVDVLDTSVLKFLAAQKLNDLFPKPIKVHAESEVRARASLTPLHQVIK